MTLIHLERRESAHNRQQFYKITVASDPVRWLGAGAGVGPDRAAGHDPGDVVRDGRRSLGGGGTVAPAKGKTGLPGRGWVIGPHKRNRRRNAA